MSADSSTTTKTEEKKNEEPIIEFSKAKTFPEEIKEEVKKVLIPLLEDPKPTLIVEKLSSMLNKKFGAGWNVVAGGHFSASFTFIEGMYTEAKVKQLVVSMAKGYVPQK